MWSNDKKCKYMFMFPLQNLARKELNHVNPHHLNCYPDVLSLRQITSIHSKILLP